MKSETVKMYCRECKAEVMPRDFSNKGTLRTFMVTCLCEPCQEKVLESIKEQEWQVKIPGYVVCLDGFDKQGENVWTFVRPGWIPTGLNEDERKEDEAYFES